MKSTTKESKKSFKKPQLQSNGNNNNNNNNSINHTNQKKVDDGEFNVKKRNASALADANARKSFLDQKVAKKQRQMQRPHYEMVTRAKEIWNIIREKDVEKTKRTKLVAELYALVKGKIYEVAAKHDASRVIQSLMKHGTPEHRAQIVLELKDHVIELAKTQYGCFLVQKLIQYGSKQDRATLVKQFTGQVVNIATHNIAANVLEFAQEHLQPAQLSGLKLEFFGKEFAYFKHESKKNLRDILQANPQKQNEVLQHLAKVLNRMVDKQLLGLAFVQSLMWDYFNNAPFKDLMQMIPNVRDAALALLATRNGARVVNKCLALSTPKDRKRIVKCLKDKMLEACNHPSGYLVLLRILDVVDDTVLLQKSVLSELNGSLLDIALHAQGRKVLLQMLSPLNKKYLSSDDLELLAPPMVPSSENPEQMVVNYKKDPEKRRTELLRGLMPKLEDMCIANLEALLRSKEGRDVLIEVAKQSSNEELQGKFIEVIAADPADAEDEDEEEETEAAEKTDKEPLYSDEVAHYALRRIIQETNYAMPLLEAVKSQLPKWIETNRGCFVVLAFLENKEHCDESKVKAILKKELPLKTAKKTSSEFKGFKLLCEKLL